MKRLLYAFPGNDALRGQAAHGVFFGAALQEMHSAGIAQIATCNTIPHETNAIDISGLLSEGIRKLT